MKRCLPICLLLLSFSAHGALTKWVDADGKVHYSDEKPPENVKVEVLTPPRASASGVPPAETFNEREAGMKRTKKNKEEASSKQGDCESARANLRTLENSPQITIQNDRGENILMDDSTRWKQIEETRKQISALCN